ncbi:MAG: hypothetical protein OEZ48_07180 [Candidatus Bathyarchaeota archaeon]|nr:hypothetical protein [Candidatus Bathyarchaeota archaeon]
MAFEPSKPALKVTETEKQPKTAEAKVEKPKAKAEKKAPAKGKLLVSYPLETKINDYGFVHFSTKLLGDLGWHKGMKVSIGKSDDGSITMRKV